MVGEISSPTQVVMVRKCANSWCSATHHDDEGKLFRLDIDLGNKAGADEHKTEYIWLCAPCANKMHPKLEVNGDTVILRLTKNEPMRLEEFEAPLRRAN
jgi:hypothetical protein